MITKPRLHEPGDSVTSCAVVTNSNDQADPTLICRLPPNATTGSVLSIRAFDFSKAYTAHTFLILDWRDDKLCRSPLVGAECSAGTK